MADQKVMGSEMLIEAHMPNPSRALQDIFDAQKRFGSKFCKFGELSRKYEDKDDPPIKFRKPDDNIKEIRREWLLTFLDCIEDEISEIRNWLPWKHWKSYENFELQETELKFELIDILHFIVSIFLLMGWNADDVFKFHEIIPERRMTESLKCDIDSIMLRSKGSLLQAWMIDIEDNKSRIKYTNKLLRGMIVSIGNSYNNPDNGQYYKHIMRNLFSLFALWGMTGKDVYNYYMSKNKENFARQERGY